MPDPRSDRRATTAAAAVAVMLALAGCGGAGRKKAAALPARAATSTSSLATTTTSSTLPPVAPLTGLPQPDGVLAARVALVLKIDNVEAARPQTGITKADLVYEEMVEGGLTRLISVFQSTDADPVGPVRSTRTTDIDIVSALNNPLYGYSGGNAAFVARLHAARLVDVGDGNQPNLYVRGAGFPPDNLYTRTSSLFALSRTGSHPPPPFFKYRSSEQAVTAAGAAPASHVDVHFPAALATWDWDTASRRWLRTQNGTRDVDRAGRQMSAANVVVQYLPYVTDGYATGEGVTPAPPIPRGVSVGQGDAIIFTGGMLVKAHWSKASPDAVTQYTDANGQPVLLSPGETWIELAAPGTATAIR